MNVRGVQFVAGDAFDPDSVAGLSPRPDVVVVSGLYELFPDNERISRSLGGIARAVPPGGYLLYPNQPWHPQLAMIARVPVHVDGSLRVMRCRALREMD